jgi:hypothetical protein
MTQVARPISDVSTGDWSTAPLWSKLNDQSDATFVSSTNTNGSSAEVQLAELSEPGSGARVLRLNVRKAETGGNDPGMTVDIKDGTTTIQSFSVTVSSLSFYTEAFTITNAISNWNNIRVQITRTGGGSGTARKAINVAEVWFTTPAAPSTEPGGFDFTEVPADVAPTAWVSKGKATQNFEAVQANAFPSAWGFTEASGTEPGGFEFGSIHTSAGLTAWDFKGKASFTFESEALSAPSAYEFKGKAQLLFESALQADVSEWQRNGKGSVDFQVPLRTNVSSWGFTSATGSEPGGFEFSSIHASAGLTAWNFKGKASFTFESEALSAPSAYQFRGKAQQEFSAIGTTQVSNWNTKGKGMQEFIALTEAQPTNWDAEGKAQLAFNVPTRIAITAWTFAGLQIPVGISFIPRKKQSTLNQTDRRADININAAGRRPEISINRISKKTNHQVHNEGL